LALSYVCVMCSASLFECIRSDYSGLPNRPQVYAVSWDWEHRMYLPRGIAQPTELHNSLSALGPAIPDAIVNWRYTIGEDWSGDPAIFFWVTLSDEAAKRWNLRDATGQMIDLVKQRVDPVGQWGLIPYFSFRSQSEQARLREEVFG
jgi:hypothetical protein